MIQQTIKSQLLQHGDDEHEVYRGFCETWNLEDNDDLYNAFKVEYDAIIESDWWEQVQQEKRASEFFDEQIRRTDEREDSYERQAFINKYGE